MSSKDKYPPLENPGEEYNHVESTASLTDKEIIKALECCGNLDVNGCHCCPLHEMKSPECLSKLCAESVDLINRQQAEIERVKSGCKRLVEKQNLYKENMQATREWQIEQAKAETIKEFAERCKEKQFCFGSLKGVELVSIYAVEIKDVDNLVKEMVGEDERRKYHEKPKQL